jgi:peptidoglycan hydrolase FlgJ
MAIRAGTVDPSGQLALDANALSSLREQAKSDPRAALSKAAGQFEALFLQMLLKQMREALPQDGPLTSDTTKMYTSMFDQQLAQKLSDSGVGLRKVIERQLARQLPGAGTTDASAQLRASAGTLRTLNAARAEAARSGPQPASSQEAQRPAAARGGLGFVPAGVQAFIDKLAPHAETVAKAMGIPASYLVAQAGLETGWGRSQPRTANGGNSHNLFGIKAGASWKGPVVEAPTTEYVDGRAVHRVERFRAYASYTEALADFAKVLTTSTRYADALARAGDAQAYAHGLQRAGYATDPAYGAKLARAIGVVTRHVAAERPAQVVSGAADKTGTLG